MTTTVAQLAVEIGANTAGLTRGLNDAQRQIGGVMSGMGRQLAGIAGALGATSLGQQIVGTAIAWEDAFANVVKTVDATPEQLDSLEAKLREMATSDIVGGLANAHMQLANIASLGGQLGVSTDALDEFTTTIAGMTVATNLSAEEAANFAARFSNVAGLDVATDIGKLGDTVVTLGNNLATSESEVAAFGLRLASLANQGFDPAEVLAYGGALSSLGVTAELGSTNLIKSVNDMIGAVSEGGEELDIMAEIAGMTSDEFAALAGQDTEKAFNNLIVGLRGLDSASRLERFRELGITGIEQQRVLNSLADGYDTLGLALTLAGEGWEENGALMEEAMRKAETTQGGLNRLQNAVTNLGVEIGMRVLPGLGEMVGGLTKVVQGNFGGGLREIATGFAQIIENVTGIEMTTGIDAFFTAMDRLPEVLDKLGISDNIKAGLDAIGRIPEILDKLGVTDNIQAGLDALARIPEIINLMNIPEKFATVVETLGMIPVILDKLGVGENIQAGLDALARIPELISLLPNAGDKIRGMFVDLITDLGSIANNVTRWADANSGLALGLGGLAIALYLNQGLIASLPALLAGTRIGMILTAAAAGIANAAMVAWNVVVGIGSGLVATLTGALTGAMGAAAALGGTMLLQVGAIIAVGLAIAGVIRQLKIFNDEVTSSRDRAAEIVQDEIAAGNLTREELEQRSFDAISSNFGGGVLGDVTARLFYTNVADALQGDAEFTVPQPIPIENLISMPTAEDIQTEFGGEMRENAQRAIEQAFLAGDFETVQMLTPIANELELDMAQIQSDLQSQIGSQPFDVTVTANMSVVPGSINMSGISVPMSTAPINVTLNTYGTNPRQTADSLEKAARDRGRGGTGRIISPVIQ